MDVGFVFGVVVLVLVVVIVVVVVEELEDVVGDTFELLFRFGDDFKE